MNRIFLFLLFLIFSLESFSQITAPKYSNAFLSIGVGARAFGMGGAQAAVASDVTSAYWNPAGLLGIKHKYEVSLMHAEYFAGIAKYDYAGVATRLDSSSVLALSVIRFGVDDIPNTTQLMDQNGIINYNKITYFSAADYAFFVSYAHKIPKLKGITTGANLKVIHRIVGNLASSWGFGLDAGAQYTHKTWKFGVTAHDITSTFNAWTFNTDALKNAYLQTGNALPQNSIELTLPKLDLGAAKSFLVMKKFGVLLTADVIASFDGKRNTLIKSSVASFAPVAGIELDYKKIVFLRGGVSNFQKVSDFTKTYTTVQPGFGVGVKISRFMIDYALTALGSTSNPLYSNVFSLKVNLN